LRSVARSKSKTPPKRKGRPVKYPEARYAALVRLDVALAKQLRAYALEHDLSFTELVERVMREWWDGQKKAAGSRRTAEPVFIARRAIVRSGGEST
jgi:hypothetical protein